MKSLEMDRYRIRPASSVRLGRFDPEDSAEFAHGKDEAREVLAGLSSRLASLQELLWAEGQHKLLVILQGMDTSGKDGVIRHVFQGVNPQGVRVANFKVPTAEELAHDFLWRVHSKVPGRGEITIFNCSHYEDVLVVGVRKLAPAAIWKKRFQQIVDFERLLAESGTTILKFFLHIDAAEQKRRLEARLAEPEKRWKFNPGDVEERKLWSAYQRAYEEALEKTTSSFAPWYVVPANRKWYRNLVVGSVLVETLESLKMRYPEPEFDPASIVIP